MAKSLVIGGLQRYWRLSRSLTMGAQGAVIDAGNRVLLLRHVDRPGWQFPGGGVAKGETVETALRRTLQAEAGIEIEGTPQLFGIYTNFSASSGDHLVLYVVRHWRQPSVMKGTTEIAEQGFFSVDDLPGDIASSTRARVAEILEGARRQTEW